MKEANIQEAKLDKNIKNYDALIVGAGVAGISCAYICAKLNLKTLLVEKENYLGGDVTGGLVIPVMKTDTKNINTDFYCDLVKYAKDFNAQHKYCDGNPGWFNPVILKMVFDKMLTSAGCDILFESEVKNINYDNNKINSVEVNCESNMLSIPIVSKYFIDATGNASFSKLLNCEFWTDKELKQPPSMRFIIGGVNLEIFSSFLEKIDSNKNVTTTNRTDTFIHLSTAYTWDENKKWALEPYFKKALNAGILKESDLSYFQLFSIANMPSCIALNCPRIRNYNDNDPFDFSRSIIEAREAILRLHNFTKLYLPGFEGSYISNIASKTGYREINRVKCKYDYTIEDIITQKSFDNPALCSNYPVDIHSNKKNASVLYKVCSYEFPLQSLQSKDFENLYAIGKIAGCDFKSHAALRVQSSCMSMGEAVAKDIRKNIN